MITWVKVLRNILISAIAVMLVLCTAFYIYTLDYYRASDNAQQFLDNHYPKIETIGKTKVVRPIVPVDDQIGLIFYPGGKVEAIAYIPLLIKLTDMGITCVLIDMPMNLAIFDIDAAKDVYNQHPDISKWYLAGHSLGGAMASNYMKDHYEEVEGLILLGAYPINESPVDTLVIYGTYDVKLDLGKVAKADFVFEIVDGNHANFGDYGKQKGDGESLISREEQQHQTFERIRTFIFE